MGLVPLLEQNARDLIAERELREQVGIKIECAHKTLDRVEQKINERNADNCLVSPTDPDDGGRGESNPPA